jgi:cytosine/adenosine deaminase-related metal-dependent hydrolase
MERRDALRGIAAMGVGLGGTPSGLLADIRRSGTAGGYPSPGVRTSSDERMVDATLTGAAVWLPAAAGGGEIRHDVSVRIEGSRIVDVSSGDPSGGGDTVDLSGHLLLPGLISGHTHVAGGSSTRGLIETGRSYARPLAIVEELLDDDDLDALTAYNLAELMRSGCTAQLEMSLSLRQARSYARVARRMGARGWVGGMIPGIGRLFPIWFGTDDDLAASEPATLTEIAENAEFARGLSRSGDGLVLGMMTPHAADTQTPASLAALAAAARDLGTGIHTHLSQGARETSAVRRRHGLTPTQWLERAGLMDGPFFGAHLTAPEWGIDAPILRARGAVYSTCPSAGGAGGATQPYPEALGAGLEVNVGIDTHGNDMIENLKLAVLFGQARAALLEDVPDAPPHRAPTAVDAVRGCTTVPADALGRPDLGRIEVGSSADLVAVDVQGLLVGSGSPPPEPLNNLLYANGHSVSWVCVDGRVQVSGGRWVGGDAVRITEDGGRVARRIWSLLEAEGWFDG